MSDEQFPGERELDAAARYNLGEGSMPRFLAYKAELLSGPAAGDWAFVEDVLRGYIWDELEAQEEKEE